MKYIDPEMVRRTVGAQGSRTFSVLFRKQNGKLRRLNTRRGVRCKLAGGRSTIKSKSHLMTSYDLQKHAWRCFNIERVVEIRAQGRRIRS